MPLRTILTAILCLVVSLSAQPAAAAWSFKTMSKNLASWHGHSIDQVVAQWGFPSAERKILGRHLVYWNFVGPDITTYSDFLDMSSKRKHGCSITFEINDQKVVIGTQFEGTRDYCGKALDLKGRPLDVQEAERAAKAAGTVYVQIDGCEQTRNQLRTGVSKIAIFPFGSEDNTCFGQNRATQEKIASTLRTVMEKNDSLKVHYSYYDNPAADPLQSRTEELWGRDNSGKPNTLLVYQLGQERDVEAVLMSWRPSAGVGYCTGRMPPYPIELYLIDIKSKCTLHVEGEEENLEETTKQFFARFLNRPFQETTATTQEK